MTKPPPAGEKLELVIAKSAFGGDGIAFSQGKVCFVEGALPGERVVARVFEEKKNFSRASIVEILEPSAYRGTAPCRYLPHCGGCQYQHVEYKEELRMKEAQLADILKPLLESGFLKIKPIVASDREYGYRNGVTLHPIFSKKNRPSGGRQAPALLGFIGKDNISKIPVKSCLLADERLSSVFGNEINLKKETDKLMLKLSEEGEIVSDTEERFFRICLGGQSFLASSKGFFQNNLFVAERLADQVSQWIQKLKPDVFFDVYAGVGTFSMLSALEVPKIVCVEESGPSVQALNMNREERKISSMRIAEGKAEKIFPGIWEKEKSERSVILLDPPRQGIAAGLANFLSKNHSASGLIYISCDPVTLVRDLKIILSLNQWKTEEIIPFDMFPRTKHLEVAILLTNHTS